MTPNQDWTGDNEFRQYEEGDMLESDNIDDQLLGKMEEDLRLQSGIPDGMRQSDLDFIKMSGLTRPATSMEVGQENSLQASDLDPSKPVSFFEEGVADVDARMAPRTPFELSESVDDVLNGISEYPAVENASIAPDLSLSDALASSGTFSTRYADPVDQARYADPVDQINIADTPSPAPFSATLPGGPPPESIDLSYLDHEPVYPSAREMATVAGDEPPYDAFSGNDNADSDVLGEDDLLRAEQLLQALERQPRDNPAYAAQNPTIASSSLPPTQDEYFSVPIPAPMANPTPIPQPGGRRSIMRDDVDPSEEVIYNQPLPPKNRRHAKRSNGKQWKIIKFVITRTIALGIIIALIYGAYLWIEPRLVTPDTLFQEATSLAHEGRFMEASSKFEQFANLHPNHPKKQEAQFEAAFTLLSLPETTKDETQAIRTRALEQFQKFVSENPTHILATRSKILMGILCYKLDKYEDAMNLLRDPNLQLSDNASALPALRTLAQAYIKLGKYAEAETAYIQATAMSDNATSDADYTELGNLYHKRAEDSASEEEKKSFLETSVKYWTYAIQIPGIDPTAKEELKKRIEVIDQQLGIDPNAPPKPVAPPAPAPVVSSAPLVLPGDKIPATAAAPAASPSSETAQAASTTPATTPAPPVSAIKDLPSQEKEVNPAVEAAHLNNEHESVPPVPAPPKTKEKPAGEKKHGGSHK